MVVDLRTDVDVQPAEIEVLSRCDVLYDVQRVAVHVEAEFAERRGCHDRLVCMRRHAGVYAHEHVLFHAPLSRLFVEQFKLVQAVDDKKTYPVRQPFVYLARSLVVAVEKHLFHIRARLRHEVKLAAGHHVEPQSVRRRQFRRRHGRERLVGERHRARTAFVDRRDEGVADLGYVLRVHDVKRSAELRRKLRRLERTYHQIAVFHIKGITSVHSFRISNPSYIIMHARKSQSGR